MKALTTLVGTAALALLAAGCEIHVGHIDGDASFWDDEQDSGVVTHPSASVRPSATSAASEEPEDATADSQPNVEPDSGSEVTEDAATSSEDASTTPTATASAAPSPSASATPVPESSYLCVAPVATDACDVCVEKNCKVERTNCCGEACEDIWPEVQGCMLMITDAGDPVQAQEDLDACLAGLDPDGNSMAFDMDEQFQLLLSCVNTTYTGPADDTHAEGDGTCTLECYGVPTLMDE